MSSELALRTARDTELDRILFIEAEAGRRFLEVGIDDSAFGGLSPAQMREAIAHDLLIVLAAEGGPPVAFALCESMPRTLHLHELDVLPALQGQGLGRRLLGAVQDAAQDRGLARVTLTTYRDVPFNRPFYERYGFAVLPPPEHPPWLQRIRQHEAAVGLDVQPRVAMVMKLRGSVETHREGAWHSD